MKNMNISERRTLAKLVILTIISLLTVVFSDLYISSVKAEDTGAPSIVSFNDADETVLADLNDLYYGGNERVEAVKISDNEWSIRLDHTGIEPALADQMDESYVTSLMCRLEVNKVAVKVTAEDTVIDNYIMERNGEGYEKTTIGKE